MTPCLLPLLHLPPFIAMCARIARAAWRANGTSTLTSANGGAPGVPNHTLNHTLEMGNASFLEASRKSWKEGGAISQEE